MKIEFDNAKDKKNQEKHGLSLARAIDFDWDTAIYVEDTRCDYGETRINAIGMIGRRLHSITFTARHQAIRIISLRKSNKTEAKRYEKEISSR